jgi:hypothetical protein
MGKKKSSNPQNHQTQSFGQMVSKAALSQMLPQIEDIVRHNINQLGNNLARQSADTIEHLHSRIITLEAIIMDRGIATKEELGEKIASLEDAKNGTIKVDGAAAQGDSVRVTLETKTKDQEDYQGKSMVRIDNVGTGNTFGPELESAILGMVAPSTKEVNFGQDGQLSARISLNRVSRPLGAENANQA